MNDNEFYELIEEYDDGELYSDGAKAVKFVWGYGEQCGNVLGSFAICEVGTIEDGEFTASDDIHDKYGWWIPEEYANEEEFFDEAWEAMEEWQAELLKEIYEGKIFK